MELEELKGLWSDYHTKLDENLVLNRRILKEIHLGKAKSRMRRLMILRMAEALWFLVIVIALWAFIAANLSPSAPTIAALVLNVFSTIGLAGSIGQLALIGTVDYSGPVTRIQRQLAKIRAHGIAVVRLLFLSLPFYMAYILLGFKLFFNVDLSLHADRHWLIVQVIISLVLIIPAVWLSRELSFKGTSHKWVRRLIDDSGDNPIAAAVRLLDEVREFENEDD